MKKEKKGKITVIVTPFIFLVLVFFLFRTKIISIPVQDLLVDINFNFLTVNTVFAGFSFTVLGLLISLSGTTALENLKETSFLREYCTMAVKSIIFFLLSIAISLYFILGINCWIESLAKRDIDTWTISFPYLSSIVFLVYGIFLFCKSVHKLAKVMNKNFEINEKKGREKVDKFNKAMNQ